jgi:hypothetical protein
LLACNLTKQFKTSLNICIDLIDWESTIVLVLLCTICVREWKETQGGNWGVKMNRKLQQGCENELLLQKEYIQYY